MKTQDKPLLNKPEYRRTVRAAKQFAEMLSGDFGYSDGDSNRLALESMVAGWIMGQPKFSLWMAGRLRLYPRTAIIDEVQDQALQAIMDAVGDGISGHHKFRTSNPERKTLEEWQRDYTTLVRDYVSTRRQLNRLKELHAH